MNSYVTFRAGALALGLALSVINALAVTEENISRELPAAQGGGLIVDVDFGSIEVFTNGAGKIQVDAWRKVVRKKKAQEEEYLKSNPVTIQVEGDKVVVRTQSKDRDMWSGKNRNEARYKVSVPAQYAADAKTSGGSISISGLAAKTQARTSGGSLKFAGIKGDLNGHTSGGSISTSDCAGKLDLHTSGGSIQINQGSGELAAKTAGGSITVRGFKGPLAVRTSGGSVHIEEATGAVDASTSGGSVRASLTEMPAHVNLSTSGGGVAVALPPDASFELDAETSAGSVRTDFPVTVVGKLDDGRLKGKVGQGGSLVHLRTSAGSIEVRKR
jgi:DUF4097 and DUF4098 domain-containing protein YvlB